MNGAAAFFERLRLGVDALVRQVPRVLADPRAYQREAMLLALFAALTLVFVVVAGMLLADWIRDFARRRSVRLRVRRRGAWTRWVWALCLLELVLLTAALAPFVPATGSACGACHVVRPSVDAWAAGTHHEVSCYSCHASGAGGALAVSAEAAARLVLRSYASRRGVSSSACLGCHASVRSGVIVRRVRMRHSDVIEAMMSCTECHQGVGHEGASGRVAIERSKMSLCLTCHDGKNASSECVTCHLKPPLDIASGTAATAELKVTCRGCHSEAVAKKCIDCHGLEMPHPDDFLGKHAGLSAASPAICERCHDQAGGPRPCACHTDTNVHGTYSDWFRRHGTAAVSGGRLGCNCHQLAFCAMCHEKDPFNPGR